MEIRPLKTKDFFIAAKILAKIGNKVTRQLSPGINESQAGLLLLTTALEHAEGDMMEWLADIAGMTPEQFSETEFDTPLLIIEELIEKEDIPRFFGRVRELAKKYSEKQ
jgi:hypothetical protein